MYDRQSRLAVNEALAADTQVVNWYLKDEARRRSSALINFALDPELAKALTKSNTISGIKVDPEVKKKAQSIVQGVAEKLQKETDFTALFAVDRYGRVVARIGFDEASGIEAFDLGGYPVVADALHGWVRDDMWALDERVFQVVSRPVEGDTSQPPAGAIVGLRELDNKFAMKVALRTHAAVAFFTDGTRVRSAAPENFDASQLDAILGDKDRLKTDEPYQKNGVSDVRILQGNLGVIYARLPGEARELGAGFAVGRNLQLMHSPMGFLKRHDDKDKKAVNFALVAFFPLLTIVLGFLFTYLEHSRPLGVFRNEAQRMAKGETDSLSPSKFRGGYRKIASDINDGFEAVFSKGGFSRKAADLEQVLGPIPTQPAMSAFSFPGADDEADSVKPSSVKSAPKPVVPPPPKGVKPPPPKGGVKPPPPAGVKPPKPDSKEDKEAKTTVSSVPPELLKASAEGDSTSDGMEEWKRVFDEFVALKKENGESVEGLTFEKFQNTLRKNRDALISKHGCSRVKFSVYTKDGRAALKASPVK
jgi:hypothetical protein